LRDLLQITSHCEIDTAVALGYPDEQPVVEQMNDSIKYYLDADDVLHVPKRKLDDVWHHNHYTQKI